MKDEIDYRTEPAHQRFAQRCLDWDQREHAVKFSKNPPNADPILIFPYFQPNYSPAPPHQTIYSKLSPLPFKKGGLRTMCTNILRISPKYLRKLYHPEPKISMV